jgi:hypothetical protein
MINTGPAIYVSTAQQRVSRKNTAIASHYEEREAIKYFALPEYPERGVVIPFYPGEP